MYNHVRCSKTLQIHSCGTSYTLEASFNVASNTLADSEYTDRHKNLLTLIKQKHLQEVLLDPLE